MKLSKLSKSYKQLLITVMVISVIFGGITGGVVGVISASWAQRTVWPQIATTFGLSSQVSQNQTLTQGENGQTNVVIENSATIDVVKNASPAVVSIIVTQDLSELYNRTGPFFPFDDLFFFGDTLNRPPLSGKQEVGGGSGFIITTDGMIVTNRHVVDRENAEYTVMLNDGTQYEAKVLARDDLNDIAIMKIEADDLPVLDLGNSDNLNIGQTVIAIGNSLGEYRNTVTKGVVSGINRRVVAGDSAGFSEVIEEAIQTDAAINPGNSGGPLLDLFGKVIGVNTAVSREGQLIGFAIPMNSVKNVIDSVREYGRIVRPFLGVRYILLNQEIAEANGIEDIDYGALIVRGDRATDLAVVPGSPADISGLVENDIILEVNGEKITQEKGLSSILSKYKPDQSVRLKVFHKGDIIEVEASLIERE
jgi:serine protease Do